jgi:hypothetical protein
MEYIELGAEMETRDIEHECGNGEKGEEDS